MIKKFIKKAVIEYYKLSCRIPQKHKNYSDNQISLYEKESMDRLVRAGYVLKKPFLNKLLLKKENRYNLSLLVPVYNSENYVKQCLDSLVGQKTQYNYQIVIVNDGSTDGTSELLNGYKDYTNVIIFTQKNMGISAARNQALQLAEGEYVGFIDNDDYVKDDYVDKLLRSAYAICADVVKCGYSNFDEQGNIINNQISEAFRSQIGFQSNLMKYDGLIWGGVYRRELFEDISFPEGYWYEDMITRTLLYPICKNAEYISEALYCKRNHANNASKVVWGNSIKCMDQILLAKEIQKKQEVLDYSISAEDIQALVHEYGAMASGRVTIKYFKEAFYLSLLPILELISKTEANNIKWNELEKEFIDAIINRDLKKYRLAMVKMRWAR